MNDVKPAYLSKTLWVNLVLAVSAMFVPSINEWVLANPDVVASLFAGINVILRFVTKSKLTIW